MADLIDRQAAIDICLQYCPDDDGICSKNGDDLRNMLDEIEALPTVDAVAVVRCGQCVHNCGRVDGYICCDKTQEISIWHSEDWFCADGEREDDA